MSYTIADSLAPSLQTSGTVPTIDNRLSAGLHAWACALLRGMLCLLFLSVWCSEAADQASDSGDTGSYRVLQLDGVNSFVELPLNIFTNLTEATVECWARWDAFQGW